MITQPWGLPDAGRFLDLSELADPIETCPPPATQEPQGTTECMPPSYHMKTCTANEASIAVESIRKAETTSSPGLEYPHAVGNTLFTVASCRALQPLFLATA